MATPLVTIITPTYNRAGFLRETVESVLSQDYPAIEYIVLDDGSNDNTAEIMAAYGEKVKYIYHGNMGETATVNKGFAMSGGDIVCVINSDDPFYTNQAVSTAVRYLNEHADAVMAYPDWVAIDETGAVLHKEQLPQYTFESMLKGARVCIGPGMFIRRSTIQAIGPRNADLKYVGDLDYSFRMASKGKIVHIPHYLATHRTHKGSLSSSAKGKRMAHEVAGLGMGYVDGAELPEGLNRSRKNLAAKWYFIAIPFAGRDYKAAFELYKRAMKSSFVETMRLSATFIIKKIIRAFSLIFRR